MVTTTKNALPVVLIAAAREHSLTSGLQDNGYAAVVHVHTGTLALEWAPDLRPDTIILDADLPDLSGIEVCRLLHSDLRIGHGVPILILAPDKPTPEQRVTALRAGAWDFLRYPWDPEDLSLKLQTYMQAKRNIDVALAEGVVDPTTGLHSRPALARRARELGALMGRAHGALACVVFSLETDPVDAKTGTLLVNAARLCDVVGMLSPTEFAMLAPRTDDAGAVRLAQRIASTLERSVGSGGVVAPGSNLRAGYDAVGNIAYSPIDPVELLARASAAVRNGKPDQTSPWVRRFDVSMASSRDRGSMSRTTPAGFVLDKGGTGV